MAAPINTRNYAWKDVEIRLNGRVLTSVEGVSWTSKQEKEAIYGKGVEPLAIKAGNKSYDGSLDLLQDEMESILDAAPGGDLLALDNMDIQVAFADNGLIVRYSLIGVTFTEAPRAQKQNDKVGRISLPFMFLAERRV